MMLLGFVIASSMPAMDVGSEHRCPWTLLRFTLGARVGALGDAAGAKATLPPVSRAGRAPAIALWYSHRSRFSGPSTFDISTLQSLYLSVLLWALAGSELS